MKVTCLAGLGDHQAHLGPHDAAADDGHPVAHGHLAVQHLGRADHFGVV